MDASTQQRCGICSVRATELSDTEQHFVGVGIERVFTMLVTKLLVACVTP